MVRIFDLPIQRQTTWDVRSACRTTSGRGCWRMYLARSGHLLGAVLHPTGDPQGHSRRNHATPYSRTDAADVPERDRRGLRPSPWTTVPALRPRHEVLRRIPEGSAFGGSTASDAAAEKPEFEQLCFTLHPISTIRHEWRQPLAVTELPFQALHLSRWIFTRVFV